MNFMNSKGLFLQPVTLPAAPQGAPGGGRGAHRRRAKRRMSGEEEGGEREGYFLFFSMCIYKVRTVKDLTLYCLMQS